MWSKRYDRVGKTGNGSSGRTNNLKVMGSGNVSHTVMGPVALDMSGKETTRVSSAYSKFNSTVRMGGIILASSSAGLTDPPEIMRIHVHRKRKRNPFAY